MNDKSVILFPFHKVAQYSRIIIYGAGDVGQAFYWEIRHTGYAEIVGWIDQAWSETTNLEGDKIKLKDIPNIDFDYIVVAMNSEKVAGEIKELLLSYGVAENKIIADSGNILHYSTTNFREVYNPGCISSFRERKSSSGKLRLGFLSAGNMAHVMAETIQQRFRDLELYAVASRDIQKAKQLAEEYGIKKTYDSYQQMVEDEHVDIVYISSPVVFHYEHTKMALMAGKHVICEKPFVVNYHQANELICYAQENNLFLTDGLWTAYLPLVDDIRQIIASGLLGKISTVTSNQHYFSRDSARLNDYALCGGAFLERGCYLIYFTEMLLGKNVQNIKVTAKKKENGIDIQEGIVLEYPEALAMINCGLDAFSDRKGCIYADKGYMVIEDANEYKKLSVFDGNGQLIRDIRRESGYHYEIQSCIEAIRAGKLETEQRSHSEILYLMKMMDKIRNEMDLNYICDET